MNNPTTTGMMRARFYQRLRAAASIQPDPSSLRTFFDTVAGVWKEALSGFSAHSGMILLIGVTGFASGQVFQALVTAWRPLSYKPFAFPIHNSTVDPTAIAQVVIGLSVWAIARAAITWIALHDRMTTNVSVRAVARAIADRWQALLLSSVSYSVVMVLALAGFSIWLHALELDAASISPYSTSIDKMPHALVVKTIGGLAPDPGVSLALLFNTLSASGAPVVADATDYAGLVRYYAADADYLSRRSAFQRLQNDATNLVLPSIAGGLSPITIWVIGLGSIVLLVGADTLLRMRTVIVMRMVQPSYTNVLAPLVDSARIGYKHLGFITAHAVLLRLASVGFTILFVSLPLDSAQSLLPSGMLQNVPALSGVVISMLLMSVATTLVGAILTTFGVIYDARLYHLVQARSHGHDTGHQESDVQQPYRPEPVAATTGCAVQQA